MRYPRFEADREPQSQEGTIDMPNTLKAAGDTWRIRLGDPAAREGYRNLLFICESNGQRPYRVVEIPDDGSPDDALLGRMGEADLEQLFHRAASLGAPAS